MENLMRVLVLAAALAAIGFAAMAQQSPTPDPRIAGPMMQALQAELVLRDAALKAMQEDSAKRETQWQDWFKAWCGDGCGSVKVGSQ